MSELVKKQQQEGMITDVQLGTSPRKAYLNKIERLVTSYPYDKIRELGRNESEAELGQFCSLFNSVAKDLIYIK